MSNQFHVGGGYFRIGDKFDSRNRYIRNVANTADTNIYMCRGPSLAINPTTAGQAGWRWQCGPTVVQSNTGVTPPTGFNTTINAAI